MTINYDIVIVLNKMYFSHCIMTRLLILLYYCIHFMMSHIQK